MILRAEGITKEYIVRGGAFTDPVVVRALRGVSFGVEPFETLGIVGESGSGKSTLAKIVTGLVAASSGSYSFDPKVIVNFRKDVQIIFQNPYASLNPRMRVGDAVMEPLLIHKIARGREAVERARGLFESVGLDPDTLNRFPSQFSGGQRQRICIARSLACEPKFLVLDEPVSSLDLTVQIRLLELLLRLKKEFRLTYAFISHNLGVIRFMAERVMVMRDGAVVESGETDEVFSRPRQEYTRALLKAAGSG